MLITINILSAMSIVMALLIPYFILLHLNNKLRKEVEGALNRVLELKVYSKMIYERLIQFMEVSNVNFDSQDKNWENENNISKSFRESFLIADRNFKAYDENFENIVNEIENLYELVNQKTALKEILETPITVKKPACETKLKLKEEVNANDIQTVTEIVNKVNFKHSSRFFEKGDIFILTEDNLKVYRNKILFYENNSYTTSVGNIMKKLLKFNELNEN